MAKIIVNNPRQVINGGAKKYYFKVKGLGGPKGDKGDKGDTGATGPQGPQGNAATVSIGSTTTLPVGNDATVTNSGSIYNAVLNFGIPQGPRGPQGATGAKGDKGDKGDQGNPGPQGEKGTNATVTVGTTITTEPGTQAYAWNSSSNPSNAVINFNIPRGATGSQGPQGIQGPIGPAGADGESFTPVVVSSLPTTGAEGKLYLTPKAHTTSTATGNPIEATVTEQAGQLESFQLDGDTYQQSYTGKNLAQPLDKYAYSLNVGATIESQSDGTVVFKTSSSSTSSGLFIYKTTGNNATLCPELFTAGYTVSFDIMATDTCSFEFGVTGNHTTSTISTTKQRVSAATATGAGMVFYNNSRNGATITISNIQVEAGSTATSFEPYVGGVPSPNPDYPQQIQTVTGEQTVEIQGKNLFRAKDGQYRDSTLTVDVENGVIHVYGHQHASYDQNVWIPVEDIHADGTYTLTMNYSGSGGGSFRLTKDKSYQAANNFGGTYYSPNRGTPVTASATNITYNWILIYLGHGSSLSEVDYYINPQFESGSLSTYFSPYSKQTYTINLGSIELCKLGTYQDYIYKSGGKWYISRNVGKIILDGSEGWSNNPDFGNGFLIVYNSSSPFYGKLPAGTNKCQGFCSHFAFQLSSTTWTGDGKCGFNTSGVLWCMTLEDMTTADFAAWLATAKPTLYYPLATPTDTEITNSALIAQLEAIRTASLENGANTITNTATGSNLAGDMEIGYYGYNPTNRYDKWLWLDINNEYEQIGS